MSKRMDDIIGRMEGYNVEVIPHDQTLRCPCVMVRLVTSTLSSSSVVMSM